MKRPYLTTRQFAEVLGVETWYVYQEIKISGRLKAEVVKRDVSRGRTRAQDSIRIYPQQAADYISKYWPERTAKWNTVKDNWGEAA